MEQITEETRTEKVKIHHFYCDDCTKYLGESQEHSDGWYEELGALEVNIDNYHIKKCLCDKCKRLFLIKVDKTLTGLGFERKY